MGLLNTRNLARAKALADKNKDKIASTVNKATDAIDKKTGGKYSDKLQKVDDAARKYAGAEEPGTQEPGTQQTRAERTTDPADETSVDDRRPDAS